MDLLVLFVYEPKISPRLQEENAEQKHEIIPESIALQHDLNADLSIDTGTTTSDISNEASDMTRHKSAHRAFQGLQLPIMVRKPRLVWPGLDREGLHLKAIAGDGNCLFASLSDQLYATPDRHGEIRATIIEHMRDFRPLYEDFVQPEDIIQKRATRGTTQSLRKNAEADAFEGYLSGMARLGSYGSQAELQAFVRAYDQDVTVHVPGSLGWGDPTLLTTNDQRSIDTEIKPSLHICYGGDEQTNAHYDSSQKTDTPKQEKVLATRLKHTSGQNTEATQQNNNLNTRAIRSLKSDPTKDIMHELVTKGTKYVKGSLDILNDQRARSPSVTSSYSTGSKRSFEGDCEQPRTSKRMDRKRKTLRSRAAARQLSGSPSLKIPSASTQPTSSGPPTPTSSQDSDSSSDQAEGNQESTVNSDPSSFQEIIDLCDDDSDYEEHAATTQKFKPLALSKRSSTPLRQDIASDIPNIAAYQPRSMALRT